MQPPEALHMGEIVSYRPDSSAHALPEGSALGCVHVGLVDVEVPALNAVLQPDNVRQTLRVSSASPGGLARALRALRAAQSAGHRRSLDARVLSLSHHVTCPCFARVERFRWRVFLVRQFPGSLSTQSCDFTAHMCTGSILSIL